MSKEQELAPDLDSILNGNFDEEYYEEEGTEEEDDAENIEDTDVDQEEDEDEETNDQNADSDDDTSKESEDEEDEENAQENENKSNEDEDKENKSNDGLDRKSEEESGDKNTESNSDDNTESESNADENKSTVDYKSFYEALTNAEFKANGKMVKGFTDPSKIIRAQQMLYGFEEKMSGFKQYRPFVGSLKKTGMIDNPEKFNMMMDIMSGDKEALKQFIKTSNIDPIIDLDLDAVNYKGKNYVDSKQSLDIEDSIEIAKSLGVEDKFRETVGKKWDDESFKEFTLTPEVREDLLDHMSNRINPNDENSPIIYDAVQDKIAEMKMLDSTGTFNAKSSINQYRAAVVALSNDLMSMNNGKQTVADKKTENSDIITKVQTNTTTKTTAADIEAEKAKILLKRKEEEYKKELDKKEKLDAEKRKKASSVSKTKPTTVEKKPKFDPLALTGDDFRNYFDGIGRG